MSAGPAKATARSVGLFFSPTVEAVNQNCWKAWRKKADVNSTNPQAGTIRAALRHRDFRALLAGQAVSQFGDFLYNVALITLVYQRTGSAIWAGVTSAARVVPLLVAGPFGGIVADRFDRRRVLVTCDLARLLLMLALALVAAWHLPVVLAPVLAALATTAAAPSIPSVAGVTPRLVPDADLPGANAARSVFTAAAVILGPGLGGVLLFVSPALAFVINAATFAVSAGCVLAVRAGGAFTVTRSGNGAARGGLPARGLLRDLTDGAAALRSHPAAVRLLGADMACSFVLGMQSVLFVFVARSAGLGMNGYAFMFAALGAGGMAGTTLAGRAARLPCRRVLIAALSAVGLSVAGVAILHWAAAILTLVAVGGAASLLVEIAMNTGLQRMLPRDVFGRAYGLAVPASIGVIGVGSLLAPVLDSTLGRTGALLACAAAVLGYTAFLALPTRHSARPLSSGPGRRPRHRPSPAPPPALALGHVREGHASASRSPGESGRPDSAVRGTPSARLPRNRPA
jgi:MFS family permease